MMRTVFPSLLMSAVLVLGASNGVMAQRVLDPTAADQSAQNAEPAGEVVEATGGLQTFPPDDERATQFDGATRRDARLSTEEELRRFALPDDAVVTGSVAPADVETPVRRLPAPADPYAPIGIRNGPLTWFPALDLAIGFDSNTDRQTEAREVMTLRLTPQLRVESDWRRHALTAELRGSATYINDGRDLEADAQVSTELRLDVLDQTTVRLRGGYTLSGEAVSDRDTPAAADGTTYENVVLAGVSVERAVGLVSATLSGEVDRRIFTDTPLAGGATLSNTDRNRTDGAMSLRLSRAEGPVYRPFVEGSLRLRRFDAQRDRNGFERDSLGYGLRAGFIVSDDGPLRGEASVGVLGERFADDRLDNALAASAAASLTWDVTALTSVTLDLDTTLDPTTQAGSGVGIARSALLGISHDLRRNVELRAGAGLSDTQFTGINERDRVYTGTAGVTWRLSPVAAVRLDTTYEHEPDSAGDINRFQVEAGVTLRR